MAPYTPDSVRPPILTNPNAERVRKVRALGGRTVRARHHQLLAEGPQAVRELLIHRPEMVRDVYISEEAEERYPHILELSMQVTHWVHPTTNEVSYFMSPDAQGIIAVAAHDAIVPVWEPNQCSKAITVVLARIQDPGNVGTIIRTADAMGASAVFMTPGSVDVGNPKVIRSSAGSVFHIPIVTAQSFDQIVDFAGSYGSVVLGTSGHVGSVDLCDIARGSAEAVSLHQAHTWIFGNEARGLNDEELRLCDALVRIPMDGNAESLNVAASSAMCLFTSRLARTSS